MVRISVEDRHQISSATFVHRSSTPLINSVCENCRGGEGGVYGQKDHNQRPPIDSFFQWENKLSLPICYRVTFADDQQQSIYTPVQKEQRRRKQPSPTAIIDPQPAWINRRGENHEKSQKKIRQKWWLTTDANLFLDPAVMGIKRQGQQLPIQPPKDADAQTNNGIEFIREFFLRRRQCSFIEARLKDKAQQQQVDKHY